MMKYGARMMLDGGIAAGIGGVMTFVPGLQFPGLIIGGTGAVVGIMGSWLFTAGYITAEAGGEGY